MLPLFFSRKAENMDSINTRDSIPWPDQKILNEPKKPNVNIELKGLKVGMVTRTVTLS